MVSLLLAFVVRVVRVGVVADAVVAAGVADEALGAVLTRIRRAVACNPQQSADDVIAVG